MWIRKYDYVTLKLEYMMSPIIELNAFLKSKYGDGQVINSGSFMARTNGWRGDKENFLIGVKNEVLMEYKKALKKEYKPSVEELGNMLKGVVDLTKVTIKYEQESCIIKGTNGEILVIKSPNMDAVNSAYKIIKNELGESTGTTRVITISEDEQNLIDSVLNDNL